MQHEGEVQVCSDPWHVAEPTAPGDATRLSDLELRMIALEQSVGEMEQDGNRMEQQIAALEGRPAWTDEHAAVLKYVAAHFGLAGRGDWTETLAAARIAFPEPKS